MTLPEFNALSHDGTPRSKADLLGHPTVLWFFPVADTPGWTIEGCGFRDQFEKFTQIGVNIVGVSFGQPQKTKPWVESQKFPYEVWTDVDKTLAKTLGTKGLSPFPKRHTFVLNAEAEVVLSYTDVSVGTHPSDVLADVTSLFASE